MRPQRVLGVFFLDQDELCTPDNGVNLTCGGSVTSGTLRTLFAKAVATGSNKDDHSHPYEHTASNPPRGPVQVSVTGGPWSLSDILLNGLTTFDLYVWGLFDSGTFIHPIGGSGQTYTLGSGSGSVGSCGPGFAAFQRAVERRGVAVPAPAPVEAMPRVYKLSVDIASMNLTAYGAGYLGEGLLRSAALYLTYDERVSTPQRPVWTARNMGDASGLWTLRVSCACPRPAAKVYFQQIGRRKVGRPLAWRTSKWKFHARNTLVAAGRVVHGLASPKLRVEPA